MQRVGLLNGNNITYDKDISADTEALMNTCVISGFGVSGSGAGASILAGKALISCTRTNGETLMVYFENTANVAVDMSGTKKVYVLINQAKLDDGSLNAEDGTGVGAITTGASYPAGNYVPLYDVVGGVATSSMPALNLNSFEMAGLMKLAKGLNIASSTTADLSTATGNMVHITGTTTITSF